MDEKVHVTTGDTLSKWMLAKEEVRKRGNEETEKRRS